MVLSLSCIRSVGLAEAVHIHHFWGAETCFAPEFRNRLDGVVKFNALTRNDMKRIVIKFLGELETYVEGRHLSINWGPELVAMLEDKGYDPKMGARPLQRVISTRIKLPLSKKILFDSIANQKLTVDYSKDSDEFTIN